jgi:hypothetical protein
MNPIFNFDTKKFEEQSGISYLANNIIVALLERVIPKYNQYTKKSDLLTLMESELNNIKDVMTDFGNSPDEMLSDAFIELSQNGENYIINVSNQNDENKIIEIEL